MGWSDFVLLHPHGCEAFKPYYAGDKFTFRAAEYPEVVDTLESCVHACSLDSECEGAIFQVNETCTVATEIISHDSRDAHYVQEVRGTVAFMLRVVGRDISATKPRFYSEYCSLFTGKRSCNRERRCKYNKGLKGFNQHVFYDKNFCGLVKCRVVGVGT